MTDLVKMAEDILMTPYRMREVVCPLCRGNRWSPLCHIDGLGYIQGERCPNCSGTGYVVEERHD